MDNAHLCPDPYASELLYPNETGIVGIEGEREREEVAAARNEMGEKVRFEDLIQR